MLFFTNTCFSEKKLFKEKCSKIVHGIVQNTKGNLLPHLFCYDHNVYRISSLKKICRELL